MDEAAYRQALTASVPRCCPFEKSLLARCASCSRAEKHNIAEREAVSCNSAMENERCVAFRDSLRRSFIFALGKLRIDGPLPHAQEMRMQCGGIRGLQFALDGNGEVHDIAALLSTAQQKFGGIADLPYTQIVQLANSHYQAR